MPQSTDGNQWNILRSEVIKTLLERLNSKELEREVREELKEEAEHVIIFKCKEQYKELILTGPYTTQEGGAGIDFSKKRTGTEDLIKERERINVAGAIMQQIDNFNYVVTVAVLDRYGELVAHKDFMHLIPPRKRRPKEGEEEQVMPHQPTDEDNEHEKDKDKLKEILINYSVDLIVVAANSLEARNLKKSMDTIAAEAKAGSNKEAFVIWGCADVPKLFALSHNSQKLHKNTPQILK